VDERALALFIALASCEPQGGYYAQPPQPVMAQTEAQVRPPPVDMDALIASVVKVRGLELLEKVPVQKMSDAEFDQAFRTARDVPDGTVPTVVTKDPQFFDGFYSFVTKSIAMRAVPKSRDGDLRVVLAHEVVHALQQQHFHIDRIQVDTGDARLAFLALVEGDAQVTAYGAVAALDGIPPARLMIQTSALHATDDAAIALPEVSKLAYDQRQALTFPYEEGMRFVGTLYRAGGFDLVNRAYRTPPMQTAYILHPEVYLSGRTVRHVAPLAFPHDVGATEAVGSRIGEAGLRSLLVSLGITPKSAEQNSVAWRGDWVELGRVAGQPAVGGVIAMATEADAQALQQFLSSKGPASHRGDVVSFAFGLQPGQAERMIASSYAKVGPAAMYSPPFGNVIIPAPPVPIEQQARFGGTFNGQVFSDPGVGLVIPVPGAYRVTINAPDALLSMSNGLTAMAVGLIDASQTAWARALVHREVMRSAQKIGVVQSYTDETIQSPFGMIPERTVVMGDGRYFKVALAPICRGQATLMIVRLAELQTWGVTSGTLYMWLGAIDARGVEQSAFCNEVHAQWQ
jgi:hypothetical protein